MEPKGLRFWKFAVVLLVLCNVGLILTIWVRPAMPDGKRPETPRDIVIHRLKFTDEQIKKYDALIVLHRASMDSMKKQAREYRQQLFADLKNGTENDRAADSLAKLIAHTQERIEIVTYKHLAEVRTLCTDAQKSDFDKIIGDVTRRMSGEHRGRPGEQGPSPEEREGHHPPHDGNGPPPNDRPGPPENE